MCMSVYYIELKAFVLISNVIYLEDNLKECYVEYIESMCNA